MGKKGTSKRIGWIAGVLVIVVIAGIAIGANRNTARASQAASAQGEKHTVALGSIAVNVHGTGSLDFRDHTSLYSPLTAKVATVAVQNGDEVKKGQEIARLDDKDLEDQIDQLTDQLEKLDSELSKTRNTSVAWYIESPMKGRVKLIYAEVDDEVDAIMNAHNCLAVLSTDGCMRITLPLSALEQHESALAVGSHVNVSIGDEKEDGQVVERSDKGIHILIRNDRYDVDATAKVYDDEDTLLGEGKLAINSPLPITAPNGIIRSIYPDIDDIVYSGSSLFRLKGELLSEAVSQKMKDRKKAQDDLDEAIEKRDQLVITASMDAVVGELTLVQGQLIQEDAPVCTLYPSDAFELITEVDELDIASIEIGQKATLEIDALPTQTFEGEVTRKSSLGKAVNGVTTYEVTLTVDRTGGMLSGMSASADIHTANKENVVVVPVEAIQNKDNQYFVNIPGATANDAPTSKPVKIGLANDSLVEITEGLSAGDVILVKSSSGNSDPFNGMMMMRGNRNQSSGGAVRTGN